jgi:hypothetical protein
MIGFSWICNTLNKLLICKKYSLIAERQMSTELISYTSDKNTYGKNKRDKITEGN